MKMKFGNDNVYVIARDTHGEGLADFSHCLYTEKEFESELLNYIQKYDIDLEAEDEELILLKVIDLPKIEIIEEQITKKTLKVKY